MERSKPIFPIYNIPNTIYKSGSKNKINNEEG